MTAGPEGSAPAPAPGPLYRPFSPGWDEPQLTEQERGRWSSFEWWYFDVGTPDGVDLDLFFTLKNPVLHRTKASLLVEYADKSTQLRRVVNFPAETFSTTRSAGRRELRIADNSVVIEGEEPDEVVWHVDVVIPGLEIHLTGKPMQRGFLPTMNGRYFEGREDARDYTAVSFSAPLMRVDGQIVVGGRTVEVRGGKGYHDHPWGTRQLMWTHRLWHWGRMASDEEGVMFADVTPSPEFRGRMRFVYIGDKGTFAPEVHETVDVAAKHWRKTSWHGISCPHHLLVSEHGRSWDGHFQATLLDTPLYNRSRFGWKLTPPADAMSGWVEYYEMKAWARWLVFLGTRLLTFFWRPFPWFGK